MPVPVTDKHTRQRGAALLVVAAVAIIAGVMMTLGIGAFKRQEPVDLRFQTLAREEFLIDQLASYVHRTRELPCPAAPDGAPGTAAFGTERAACATVNNAVGIIPFRTLNIDERFAKDAWGRYFTYAISPIFANPGPANDGDIFHRCRTDRWINDEDNVAGPGAPAPRNENAQKARFCCPAPVMRDMDLIIADAAGNPIEPAPGHNDRSTVPAAYGDINTIGPAPANQNATAFAVTIVSHGSNGAGAFTGGGVAGRIPNGNASADEIENADDDVTYVDRPMVTEPGANYFDDIVITRTQTALYSELNNASCYRPWR